MAEGRSRPPSAEGVSPCLTLEIRCACRAVRTEEAETGQAREAGPPDRTRLPDRQTQVHGQELRQPWRRRPQRRGPGL